MWQLVIIIVEWTLTILMILFFIFIRCVVLIIRVFARFGWECKPLRTSLIIFLAAFALSVILPLVYLGFITLASLLLSIGFIQLTITAKVVEVSNSDVFMKEQDSLVNQVLHTNWFQQY